MRCVVPNCNRDSSKTLQGITYHKFPTEPSLCTEWIEALHMPGWHLDEYSAVCSSHFQREDLLESRSGRRTVRPGAVPSLDVQVCRICFATDCKLYPMTTYKILSKAYETLTGLLIEDEGHLPPYLCSECTRRLLNCAHFRTTSLRAHLILLEIIKKHDVITQELIETAKVSQDPLSSNLNCDNKLDFDLDTELAAEGHLFSDKGALINSLSGLQKHITVDGIKTENSEISDTGNLNNYVMVCLSSLPQDIHAIKTENECVMNQDGANEDSTNIHRDIFIGDEYSPDGIRPRFSGAKEKAKSKIKRVQDAKKPSKTVGRMKVGTHWRTGNGRRLLIKETFSCDVCPYQTKNERMLLNHLKAHAAAISYSCNMCSFITTDKIKLTNHVKAHYGAKPYACAKCNKTFDRKSRLVNHIKKKHSGAKPYACKNCNKSFNSKTIFLNHRGTCKLTCNICSREYSRINKLKEHMKVHSDEKPYCCDTCNKSYYQKSRLISHLRTHTEDKPYFCDVCSKGFYQRDTFIKHFRTHSSDKPYSCDFCSKAFYQKYYLTKHLITHSGEKPYSCEVCSKSFYRKDSLNKHFRIHSGVKQFSCDICQRSYNGKYNYTEHMRIHSDEREYSCHICSKAFHQKAKLTNHMRVHTGEKPFSCNVCNKAFNRKDILKVHMIIHSGVKKYFCDVCNKVFSYRSTLAVHMKKHANVNQQ